MAAKFCRAGTTSPPLCHLRAFLEPHTQCNTHSGKEADKTMPSLDLSHRMILPSDAKDRRTICARLAHSEISWQRTGEHQVTWLRVGIIRRFSCCSCHLQHTRCLTDVLRCIQTDLLLVPLPSILQHDVSSCASKETQERYRISIVDSDNPACR